MSDDISTKEEVRGAASEKDIIVDVGPGRTGLLIDIHDRKSVSCLGDLIDRHGWVVDMIMWEEKMYHITPPEVNDD
jgi:hypothetical protein